MQPRDPLTGAPLVRAAPLDGRRPGWVGPLLAVALLIAPLALALWAHNRVVARAESVESAWAQVESNLQRRADLVPRLVQVVARAMRHEEEVLEKVTHQRAAPAAALQQALETLNRVQAEAPAQAGGVPEDAVQLDALQRRDAALGAGLRLVLAVAESYPQLRSTDQLLELQAQLEGSENRINAARMDFNEAVRRYNAALVELPTSLVARLRGLEPKPYFGASPEAHVATPLALD